MRIAICGPGGCGKDTLSKWLRDYAGLRYEQSTSEAAAAIVWDAWGHDHYQSSEECFADRRNHRKTWAELIWRYNGADGIRLYARMAGENDILNGIRKRQELDACRAAGLVDLSIWIERPNHEEGNLSIDAQHCDVTIHNCGSLMNFQRKAIRLATLMRLDRIESREDRGK